MASFAVDCAAAKAGGMLSDNNTNNTIKKNNKKNNKKNKNKPKTKPPPCPIIGSILRSSDLDFLQEVYRSFDWSLANQITASLQNRGSPEKPNLLSRSSSWCQEYQYLSVDSADGRNAFLQSAMVPLSALQFDEQLAGKPTKAAPKTAAPAADAPEKKTTQKACGSCGSTMAPTGAKFCPGCGCRLTQANPPVAAKAAAEEKPAEDRAQATKENVQKRAAAKAKPATKAKQAGGNVPSSAEVFYDAGALLDHETATGDKGAAESGVAEEMHGAFRGTDSNGALLQRAFRSTDSNGTTLSQLMASTGSFDVFKTDVPVDQSTEVSRKRKANNDIASAGVPRWATEYGIAARSVSPQPEPTPNKKSKTKTNPAPAGNTTSKRADPADEDKNHVEPTERDILLGRGGKSNFWPGNKDYRQELEKVKSSYNDPSLKQREKTKMSRAFVQAMISSGRRFLKKDGKGWFEITKEAARLKVAQALREENTEKSREDKRERFPPKKYYKTCPGPRKSS